MLIHCGSQQYIIYNDCSYVYKAATFSVWYKSSVHTYNIVQFLRYSHVLNFLPVYAIQEESCGIEMVINLVKLSQQGVWSRCFHLITWLLNNLQILRYLQISAANTAASVPLQPASLKVRAELKLALRRRLKGSEQQSTYHSSLLHPKKRKKKWKWGSSSVGMMCLDSKFVNYFNEVF